ncbi:sugar porter family MFS transporter [Rhizosphaericola mali]|uniref:Sugar porter family MFS transporter n=1 Tax=Rhizosphaericola mali TaxID=2545455 RepID=A0A5P2G928_9BACT|nr:sugar porter family MFS transporter [Rhizosphaericola mali]QES90819.1 sugar porter family MFS transporter [Rhizosphaericola mali]
MKNKVFGWSFIVALGGFLFGFDTAVISGAEQAIQQFWHLSPEKHGFTISVALIGTVVGAALGSIPSEKYGRRKTLSAIAFLFLITSIGTAMSTNWYLFILCRFLGGIAVGGSSVTAPIYISEIAPAKSRGKMVGMFQFMVILGILISYFSNYILGRMGENSWRFMLGIQAVPSLIYLILLRFVPRSPRWLINRLDEVDEARTVLQIINPEDYNNDVEKIISDRDRTKQSGVNEKLFQKKYAKPILLAFAMAMFNQFSGVNAILYFAPRIFEIAHFGRDNALLSSVGVGIVNFMFTLIAILIIDRIGRRTLMIIGSVGLIVSLGLVTYSFYSQSPAFLSQIHIFLFMYVAFFALSLGSVIWVFISEIFPNSVRAQGQTLGSLTHWGLDTIITFLFPVIANMAGGATYAFGFFFVMMFFLLGWAIFKMPETKGRSLEDNI